MRFAVLLLLCGCRQFLGFEELATEDAGANDGPPSGLSCVGSDRSLTGEICVADAPPLRRLEGVLDTSAACHPARGDVCLIAAQSIEIETLRVRGARALVLWSASNIVLAEGALLDIRSTDGLGPGANDSSCPTTEGASDTSSTPLIGSGGCGGPFGTAGGNGGDGNAAKSANVSIECSNSTVTLDRVRGGCPGGAGGLAELAGATNAGNSAGGIYLMAGTSITIAGVIDARGTAGKAGAAVSEAFMGGGGGGSGGLIGLDAPAVALDGAVLNALGAGGGSGGGNAAGPRAGSDGKDATLDPPTNATGATQTVNTNFGGAAGVAGGGVDLAQTGGGGGGGGGAGYIVVLGADLREGSAQIAPPISPL